MQAASTIVEGHVRESSGNAANRFQKQPVTELHDVGLVDGGDAPAVLAAGVRERELRDSRGGGCRDDLQALDDAWDDDVLESGVQILGVLAHDDEIDAGESRGDAGQVGDRPDIGKEVELLAQRDVDARKALADRSGARSLEGDRVTRDRVEQIARQRLSGLVERRDSGVLAVPGDAGAGGVEDRDHRGSHFGPDPVTGNECECVRRVRHAAALVYN